MYQIITTQLNKTLTPNENIDQNIENGLKSLIVWLIIELLLVVVVGATVVGLVYLGYVMIVKWRKDKKKERMRRREMMSENVNPAPS